MQKIMPRLTTDIVVAAGLRQAASIGIFASILRKGDDRAGAIFVEVEKSATEACLLARQLNYDNEYDRVCITGEGWVNSRVVQERLTREIEYDPDCWIVSVQDSEGRNIFTL